MDDIQRMRLDMDHWGIVLQKRLKKFQRAQPTHWVLEEAKSGLTKNTKKLTVSSSVALSQQFPTNTGFLWSACA